MRSLPYYARPKTNGKLIRKFAGEDIGAAAEWVSQFPAGDLRASAGENLGGVSEQAKIGVRLHAITG
jgi:hypothetical protein